MIGNQNPLKDFDSQRRLHSQHITSIGIETPQIFQNTKTQKPISQTILFYYYNCIKSKMASATCGGCLVTRAAPDQIMPSVIRLGGQDWATCGGSSGCWVVRELWPPQATRSRLPHSYQDGPLMVIGNHWVASRFF